MSTNPTPSPTPVDRSAIDVPVTLFRGIRPQVIGHSTLLALLRRCLTEPELIQQGQRLRELAEAAAQAPDGKAGDVARVAYKRAKENALGFVLGDYSYRDLASMNSLPPMVGLDVDSLGGEEELRDLLQRCKEWPHTASVLPSPSYRGLRVLILTDTNSTEGYADRYRKIARGLCKHLDLPIKRDLRDKMNVAGLPPAMQERILDMTPHGDDVVSDYSRLWFISGLASVDDVYVADHPTPWSEPKPLPAPPPKASGSDMFGFSGGGGGGSAPETNEELIEALLEQVEGGAVDITQGVAQWYKVGQAIYAAFGHSGQSYFERLSRFHPDFKTKKADEEWRRIARKHQPGRTGLGSLVYICRDYGIEVAGMGGGAASPIIRRMGVRTVTEKNVSYEEAQRCVLASLVLEDNKLNELTDALPQFSADCFTNQDYREIYRTIRGLQQQQGSDKLILEPVVVAARTVQRGFPSAADRVATLGKRNYYPANFLAQARLVYDEHRYARLRGVAPVLLEAVGAREPLPDMIQALRKAADDLEDDGVRRTEYTAEDMANEIQRHVELQLSMKKEDRRLLGISSGLKDLDEMLGGFRNSMQYIVAGRPAMGKSALVLKFVYAAALQGLRVLLFSPEMTMHDLSLRLASLHTGIELKKIQHGNLSHDELSILIMALDEIASWQIKLDDDGDLSPSKLRARTARHMRDGKGYDIVFLDYLQFMEWELDKNNATLNVGHASKTCKNIAKEHDVPFVVLAQLSRAVETRGGDKRPQMSDLKESGNIEQDADCVMFVYRPEYYKIFEDEQGNSLRGVAELIVEKNRHGEIGTARVRFVGELTLFEDRVDLDFDLLPSQAETPPAPSPPPYGAIPEVSRMNTDDDIEF